MNLDPALDLAPSRQAAALTVAGGVVLAVLALGLDPLGRVLALPAAVLVVALGLRDLLLRPVLSLRPQGLVVVVGTTRRRVPWTDLEQARVVTDRRTPLLELDLGDTLVVLSRHRLGRSPAEVLEAIEAVRP